MVTTTTKTLNYSIIRGNHTNSVNATITSTPGINVNYFGKIPGILKLLELIITVIALGLAASRRREGMATTVGISWPIEFFLLGEVFFLCICSTGLTYLFGQLTVFVWSVTSSVLIPKTTYFEMLINLLLGLAWITAGIVELCMTSREGWNQPFPMLYNDWGCRIAAGALALFVGILHLASFAMATKEFAGPRGQA